MASHRVWFGDLEHVTTTNDFFRRVVFTGAHTQLTVMSLAPGEEIGVEVHPDIDQFIRIEAGIARVDLGPERDQVTEHFELHEDFAVIIPAGVWHNVTAVGDTAVKLYSLYSPAEHPDGAVHPTKADADAAEHHH